MATARPPRSTLQRALLPVVGGIGFFALLGLATWGVAALLSNNPERVNENLAKTTLEVGNINTFADIIAESGPLIFPDLARSDGPRTVVLDHAGDDARTGWRAYFAYPADRGVDCKVTQIRGTRQFTDCEGRTIGVEQLMPPAGVQVIVDQTRSIVSIDLTAVTATTTATTVTTGTTETPATSDAP